MNARSFKTVFSKRLGALVAVGEHATSQGKANGASGPGASGAGEGAVSALAGIGYVAALSASFAFVSLAWAAPATNALPTGGTVVQGAASMSQNANQLNIQQATQRAAINWQSFNIGAAATVNVAQPNAQAVLLNRVVGQSPSQIFGKLQANGHVILVNPNGVLFGKDGSVNAGGFTASTLNISDANFMAGNMVYERNGSTAGIVSQGSITAAPGGYVALLGATVSNEGSITTKGGSVVMGAGETIKVPVSGTGRIKLELTPAAINASLSNTGSIVTEGGQVYMQALALNRAAAQILQSGSIDTTGEKGGEVHVLADGGHIRVDGRIKANSTNGTAGGDIYIGRDKDTNALAAVGDVSGAKLESLKGFVETSGDELKFDGISVVAKDWLLDPVDVTIDAANAATIGTNLRTTNVTIQTTGSTAGVTTAGTGNITISSAITKAAPISGSATVDTTLTLIADNGIDVNAAIGTAAGAGKLNVVMEAKGQTNGKAVGVMTTSERALSSGIRINNTSINANGGDVTLTGTSFAPSTVQLSNVGKGVLIHNAASITARNISITGTAENVSGNTSYGVVFQRYATQARLNASGDIAITGTLNGSGGGSGVLFKESGWGSQAPMISAGGDFTVRANNRASTSNTSAALEVTSGMQVQAKNISLQAETNNSTATAINIFSKPYTEYTAGGTKTWGNALFGNTSLVATNGNVLIQANRGSIVLNNTIDPTLSNGTLTAKTEISGRNIIIDNTGAGMTVNGVANANGGSIDANGKITVGTGTATNVGVLIADARAITATSNLNIAGASTGGVGINTNGVLTAGGDVNLTGTSSGTNANAHGVMLTGKVNSSGGAVNITGSSTSTTGGAGAIIQATVDAKNNITLDGRSGNIKDIQGLVIQEAVTSVDGNITVTGETKAGDPGQRAVAITANGTKNGSLKVKDGQAININANTLFIKDTSFVNAGTGTVNIKTLSTGNAIVIGGPSANDVMNILLNKQTLGIDQTELNRITAGNLVIGDTASTGKITVAAATTTLDTTGNITLQTKGDIAVNAALTVGTASANKKLALHAGGNVTQASNAAIKAAELQLKGLTNLANFTLAEKTNSVGKLAASGNKVVFTNAGALEIGEVSVSGTALSGVTAVEGTTITTGTGDLTINKDVINSTSGDVVLGAGVDNNAGDGTGGDVKTTSGIAVANNNASGKTLIFTGSAATTGLLSHLDNSFSELRLSGDMGTPGTPLAQNADSNVKYAAGTTITGGAKAQVMFREKIALNTSTITGATLNKIYGDANTKNNSTVQPALFAEMQAQLKQANPGQIITRSLDGTNGAGEFKISKATLINDFSGSLNTNNASFSTSQHLTATTHEYGALTSTKYAATLEAGKAKVEVAKKALTGSIAQGASIYGDALAPGNVNWSGNVVGDLVAPSAVNVNTTGNISQAGYLNAGIYSGIQTVTADGNDAANYSFTNVKGDYKVDQRPLTIAPGSVATKTADGTTAATVTPGALSNLVGSETLSVAATGTFSDANAGNNKAVNAFYTLQNGGNGGLASNYILALGKPGNPDTRMTGTILAAVNPVTPIAPVNNNTGSVSRVRTVSGFGGAGAATGVLDDKAVTESREVCSDVFPENCECQPSVIPSIEICFAPKSVAATKEEK